MTRIALLYLASFGTSLLGTSITAIALPLLVLFTTGSPLDAGVVALAAAVPAAVAGLLMGSLIDRIDRRTAAILADLISAAALLVLPVVDLTVGLNLGWFIAVAVLSSFGDVPGLTAREAMLPAVARAAALDPSRLIGLRESLAGVSLLVGPAVAGILVATLEPVSVLWVTAGIAGAAALLTLALPSRATRSEAARRPAPGSGTLGSVVHGLVIIARTPLLRLVVLTGLVLAVVLAALQSMVIPVHFTLRDEAGSVGFVLSALAAGLLLGGGLFAVLGSRIPRRAWFTAGLVVVAAGFLVLGILGPMWSILAGAVIVGLGGGCLNAVTGLTFVENVPDDRRGTVLGAQNAVMTLVPALGIGGAALLIEGGSLHLATTVLALLWIGAAVTALLSPSIRRMRQASP